MKDGIWITWEKQIRNRGISERLNWELFEIIIDKARFLRYFFSIIRTIKIIYRNRGKIVVVQNPSIVLALSAVVLKNIFNFPLIVDAHYAGILPFEGKNKFLMFISSKIQKYSDFTIITNEEFKNIVIQNGGNPIILQDKIFIPKEYEDLAHTNFINKFSIACICSYNDDEPYKEIFQACKIIDDDVFFYFTGNYNGKINLKDVPKNAEMLGYLSDRDYWTLLKSVDAVLDLTYRENCLVCGAYEGIAVGKPLILSDTSALRAYFFKGAKFVKPDSNSIVKGIDEVKENYSDMINDVESLKHSLSIYWEKQISEFFNKISTY